MSNPFVVRAGGSPATIDDPMAGFDCRPAPKRIVEGSPQQEDFWRELVDGSGHVLLEARAGTGKSSSCREGMHRLLSGGDRPSIRYCCYNKKIADEFRSGCPDGVEVGTMHSFGLKALSRAFGGTIEANKTYLLLDAIPEAQHLPRYLRKAISQVVSLAKNTLDPDLGAILDWYDIETYRRSDEVLEFSSAVLEKSRESTSMYDFDDMLWLPVVHGLSFPGVDFLFVDECQDLNPVQHALVPLMNPDGRTVIVGDPFQSIYAFRGADSESIPKMAAMLGAKRLPLTVSWRCPRSHAELARTLVPDFESAPDADEGEVIRGVIDEVDSAGPGDMVLCRSNAPLISGCLRLVRERRRAIVRGRALGDQLNAVVRKVEARTVSDLVTGLARWKAKEMERLDRKDGTEHLMEAVLDKHACLEAIADTCGSPAEVPGVISSLFDDDESAGRVTFSTVHRAKGSEARNVFYIQVPFSESRDARRPPPQWELDQRRNLRYVALTRSMSRLTLIDPPSAVPPKPTSHGRDPVRSGLLSLNAKGA